MDRKERDADPGETVTPGLSGWGDPLLVSPDLPAREQYEDLQRVRPEMFSNDAQGTQVVTDPSDIDRVSSELAARYAQRGWPRHWADVGVAYRDPYVLMLREAVIFPNGAPGIHHRLSTYNTEPSGVAILPLLQDRVVMVRHYRHAIRRWSWEFPRGACDAGEDIATAARRELVEETGAEIESVTPLGAMCGATGLMSMVVHLAVARLKTIGEPPLSEGISRVESFSLAEFERMIRTGEVIDAFTVGCFTHARLHGLV
jgi:ADP-ribose pyrophosphatase